MAIRFIDKLTSIVVGGAFRDYPQATPIAYDTADDKVKFLDNDGTTIRSVVSEDQTQTLTNKTLTTPTIDGVAQSALNDRQIITEVFAITGAALHAGVLAAVTFPAAAIILRALLNVTTVATAACTIDVGYTAVSATTGSDTLLDGIDANAATILADSMDATLDSGANAKAQLAASAKWVTVQEKTGDATGLVGTLTVQYILQ